MGDFFSKLGKMLKTLLSATVGLPVGAAGAVFFGSLFVGSYFVEAALSNIRKTFSGKKKKVEDPYALGIKKFFYGLFTDSIKFAFHNEILFAKYGTEKLGEKLENANYDSQPTQFGTNAPIAESLRTEKKTEKSSGDKVFDEKIPKTTALEQKPDVKKHKEGSDSVKPSKSLKPIKSKKLNPELSRQSEA